MLFFRRLIIALSVIGICSFSYVSAETLYQKNDCKTKIEEIDREIQYLEDLKRGLEGRAIRYENQAQRLQFEKDQLVESKRFWNMAEQNRKASAELEQKIQDKRQERQQFIENNNCKGFSSSIDQESTNENVITESKDTSPIVDANVTKEKSASESGELSSVVDVGPVKETVTNEIKAPSFVLDANVTKENSASESSELSSLDDVSSVKETATTEINETSSVGDVNVTKSRDTNEIKDFSSVLESAAKENFANENKEIVSEDISKSESLDKVSSVDSNSTKEETVSK